MDTTPSDRPFALPLGVFIMKDDSGHVFQPQPGFRKYKITSQAFRAQYAIACSVDMLEPILFSFARSCFADKACAIIEYYTLTEKETSQVENYLSPFLELDSIVTVFRQYIFQLINDGQVAFGIAWYDGDRHEEIFVDDHKIITMMTSLENTVSGILVDAGLAESENLEFLSQHAHGHLNLSAVANLATDSEISKFVATHEASYIKNIIRELKMTKQ